ncbi:MAG: transpeptidase family protein [Thermotogaceae bacterium]|nr:transpeptidase family protein [Thermotogaceae bacterium]
MNGDDLWKARVFFIFIIFTIFLGLAFIGLITTPSSILRRNVWSYFIPPTRGNILDKSGRNCATDLLFYVAYLDVNYLKKHLDPRLETSLLDLLRNFNLHLKIDDVLNRKIVKLGESEERDDILRKIPIDLFPYVNISLEYRRSKINEFGVGVIVGSVVNGKGKYGVEGYFDDILRGKKRGKLKVKIYGTLKIQPEVVEYVPPVNGKDVRIAIDLDLQRAIYKELLDHVRKHRATCGHVIVMESKTGKIRAMVTTSNWNDIVMGYIEPGSSIKPVVYSIALETESVSPDMTYNCVGWIKPVENLKYVIRDVEAHGLVNLEEGIVKSCNSMTVMVSRAIKDHIGEEGFYQWLRKFGFGRKTGIELDGEIEGVLREPSEWSVIDFAEIAIGQGIGVTPIQLISALNVFANDGYYVKPTILEDSKVEKRPVVSSKTAQFIKNAMKKVVEEGTGRMARVQGISIAGKTGTAQKAVEGKYTNHYHSIFVGFFPSDDPKYTILVHIDDPKGEYLGGEVAAPLFSKIVRVLTSKKIYKIKITKGVMPDLRGLSLKDALLILKSMGVADVKYKGEGVIVDQSPPPGSFEIKEVELTLQPK